MQVSAAKRLAYDDCSVARMPLSIIHAACQQRRRAASIFVAMSAIRKLIPWFIAIGIPNCTRSFEYCAAYSKPARATPTRSEEHTSELQSLAYLVCRLLLEKKKNKMSFIDAHASIVSC